MQTDLADFIKGTAEGDKADEILRKCVHCGFCTATCPTYQLLGDELDGPRGRIYLMKQVLEGEAVTERTQSHLDRCLTCRSCETTCPSGVEYGKLLEIGRKVVDERVPRKGMDKVARAALNRVVPDARLFGGLMKVGRLARPVMPRILKDKISPARTRGVWPEARHDRRMAVLEGCVQPTLSPDINAAAARYLDSVGISLVVAPDAGCCGAVGLHNSDHEGALVAARRNVDAWWPLVESGLEAIVMTASGCGVVVADYGDLLASDPEYAERAKRISDMTRDLSSVVAEHLPTAHVSTHTRVAFHPPCTLQHGLKTKGVVEKILRSAGFELTNIRDSHLCCGSAGTYSLLQPEISGQLKKRKLSAILQDSPDVIASANIGCLSHLEPDAGIPVRHWIELLA